VRVDQTDDRQVARQLRIAEQVVDPGAERQISLSFGSDARKPASGRQTSAWSMSPGSPISGQTRMSSASLSLVS
jgi:hypothetical protein